MLRRDVLKAIAASTIVGFDVPTKQTPLYHSSLIHPREVLDESHSRIRIKQNAYEISYVCPWEYEVRYSTHIPINRVPDYCRLGLDRIYDSSEINERTQHDTSRLFDEIKVKDANERLSNIYIYIRKLKEGQQYPFYNGTTCFVENVICAWNKQNILYHTAKRYKNQPSIALSSKQLLAGLVDLSNGRITSTI